MKVTQATFGKPLQLMITLIDLVDLTVCHVMKHGINKLLWPNMSITMYNEINSICVTCEAIICSEQEESYITLIQFVLKTSKKRTNENIHVIAADGIINQDCVTNKVGFDIHGQTCDVDKDSLTMYEEANDHVSDCDIESSNDLSSYNDVEI